jgi:hypothetical protein
MAIFYFQNFIAGFLAGELGLIPSRKSSRSMLAIVASSANADRFFCGFGFAVPLMAFFGVTGWLTSPNGKVICPRRSPSS